MLHGLNAGLVGQISSNFIKKKMNTILTKCRDSNPGPLNPKVTYTAPLVAQFLPVTLERHYKNGKKLFSYQDRRRRPARGSVSRAEGHSPTSGIP